MKSDRPLHSQAAASTGMSGDSGTKPSPRPEPCRLPSGSTGPLPTEVGSRAHLQKTPQKSNITGHLLCVCPPHGKHFTCVSSLGPRQCQDVGAAVISIGQRIELRHREAMWHSQSAQLVRGDPGLELRHYDSRAHFLQQLTERGVTQSHAFE